MTTEEFLELLRMVLDYVGLWQQDGCRHGQAGSPKYRNLIRAIGSNLPLQPCSRPVLHIPAGEITDVDEDGYESEQFVGFATVTDLAWEIENDEQIDDEGIECIEENIGDDGGREDAEQNDPNAMQKISALELELAQLRAQLAQVIKHQDADPAPAAPVCPATPSAAVAAPPPPPPPGPPPSVADLTKSVNVIELIRERRKNGCGGASGQNQESAGEGMDMGKVLKQLGSVKLRTVQRSPGGTPIRQAPLSDPGDPATIIAQALRRKFANCQPRQIEEDDEFSAENVSPVMPKRRVFRSPVQRRTATPPKAPFGPHMLKRRGDKTAVVQ